MKELELQKLSNQVWMRKRKGFRVRCDKFSENKRSEVLMPAESESAMDSDVAAWRVAVKLSESTELAPDSLPIYCNITVIDDLNQMIDYYVTDSTHVFNEAPQFEHPLSGPVTE